jgi:hypothetical protein
MIFDIVGSNITIRPESLMIPEFKKIWTRDKNRDKKTAINEISFVVFLCDNSDRNPYKNYSEKDREVMLIKDFFITKKDGVLQEAIDKYRKLSTTRYERVVQAALGSLEEIEDYYLGIKDQDKSEFDINEYLSSMDKLGKAIKSLRELEKQLEADRMESNRTRGNNEIGDYEIAK